MPWPLDQNDKDALRLAKHIACRAVLALSYREQEDHDERQRREAEWAKEDDKLYRTEIAVDPEENPTARYDRLADEFRRETGSRAPGKDPAPAEGDDGVDPHDRMDRWRKWNLERAKTNQTTGESNGKDEER